MYSVNFVLKDALKRFNWNKLNGLVKKYNFQTECTNKTAMRMLLTQINSFRAKAVCVRQNKYTWKTTDRDNLNKTIQSI